MKKIAFIISRILSTAAPVVLLAAWAVLATACTSDADSDLEDEYGRPTDAIFQISATRGIAEDPADDNERINSWWVALVDNSGKIAAICERDLSKAPAERDEFSLRIPTGTYTIVSFANRVPLRESAPDSYSIQLGGRHLTFAKGEQSPIKYGDETLYDESAPELWEPNHLVPMCGLQKVKITGRTTEPFEIEVVRLVAKFEILFENDSQCHAQVHSYKLDGFKTTAQYLFPTYTSLEMEPNLPEGASFLDIVRPLDNFKLTPGEKDKADIFYTLESHAATQPRGVYLLTIDLSHLDDSNRTLRRDTLTAHLTDIAYTTRNDHIRVPVLISDYAFSVETIFYPPIGGYPAKMEQNDAGQYIIRFGSIGEFMIRPHIAHIAAGSAELQPSEMKMQIETESLQSASIFARNPSIDSETGEIRGSIGTNHGKARVTVMFTISRPGKAELTYRRSILIIRD